MNEETKQAGKQDVIFKSPDPNMKIVCVTIQRPEMVVNGNTQSRIYREVRPSKGFYILRATSLFFDEQKKVLEGFAERHGLKRVASLEAVKAADGKK